MRTESEDLLTSTNGRQAVGTAWLLEAASIGAVFLASLCYVALYWQHVPFGNQNFSGDYAYTAWQMSKGVSLYRDIYGQQPPLGYLVGSIAYRLWPHPDAFRVLGLAVHISTVAAIFCTLRAARLPALAAAGAGLIYLYIPLGFVFGSLFDPNEFITSAGAWSLFTLTTLSRRRAVCAGLICGLAIMVKLTFAPLIITFGLYLLLTRREFCRPFVLTGAFVAAMISLCGLCFAGEAFIRGAFMSHMGLPIYLQNISATVENLWHVEGLIIVTALLGALVQVRQPGTRRLFAMYLFSGLLLIGTTMSAGSNSQELLVAEPAFAVSATVAVFDALMKCSTNTSRLVALTAVTVILTTLTAGSTVALQIDARFLASSRPSTSLQCLVDVAERSKPGAAPVIASPYVAMLAGRTLAGQVDDFFNWHFHVLRGDATSTAQARSIEAQIQRHQISMISYDYDLPLPPGIVDMMQRYYTQVSLCPDTTIYLPSPDKGPGMAQAVSALSPSIMLGYFASPER